MTIPEGISSIILDLGNVIIGVEEERTIEAFRERGVYNIDEIYTWLLQDEYFEKLERGEIEMEDLYGFFQNLTEVAISYKHFLHCWRAMLLEIPQERMEWVANMRAYYSVFLLSNTNEGHMKQIHDYVYEVYNLSNLDELFDKAYYSYKLKMRKPEPEIFLHILKENGIEPKETLFIDDSKTHIKAAGKLGIRTIWMDGEFDVTEIGT